MPQMSRNLLRYAGDADIQDSVAVRERRIVQGSLDMRVNCTAERVLAFAIAVMVVGWVAHTFAQAPLLSPASQDGINAALFERQLALSARLDKIESLLQYGMLGLFGNLAAHLFQISSNRRRRGGG